MRRFAAILSISLPLFACSPDPDHTPKIAEDQLKAMDKAKALEGTLQQQADQQLEQIDAQTE